MLTLLTKRTLLNSALLLLLALLVLVAWLEPGRKPPAEAENLTNLNANRVQKIRIERREGKTVVLERVEGKWHLRKPVAAPANNFRIESLLRVTEYKSLGHNPVNDLTLAKYGLDKPAVRLFLDDTEMVFGESTPLDNRRYVRLGDAVHLIKDAAYYHLIGNWTTFLSQRLLSEGVQIEALDLPGLKLALQEGQWQPQPRPERYSADAAAVLLEAWRTTQAIEVRPYSGKGGEGEIEQIRVQLAGEEEPIVFQIKSREPDLVLLRPDLGVTYHLPASRAADLLGLSFPPEAPPATPAKP